MKILSFIGFVLMSVVSSTFAYCQKTAAVASSCDTDFIYREVDTDLYYAVFIEHNRNDFRYKNLIDTKIDSDETQLYLDNCRELNKVVHSFKKYKFRGLDRNWVPLYLYKGKYYVYFPSEWTGRRMITDSTVVDWTIEGPDPLAITYAKKASKNLWLITRYGYYDSGVHFDRMRLHFLHGKQRMVIWEHRDKKGIYRYDLYIPAVDARKYDMIVSYCPTNRVAEFVFDNIDFKKLLKSH